MLALRAGLDGTEDPYVRACRKVAEVAKLGGDERVRRFTLHHGKRVQASDEARDAILPQSVQYVFGVGAIDPAEGHQAPAPKKGDKGPEKPSPEALRAIRLVEAEQVLRGYVPGADRVLAVLEQRLDSDTGGDRFAAFLHSWRNGHESFYEALDRTSGTPDSVFFYDAMLGDFRSNFVEHGDSGAEALRSLQGAHDALHAAFLAYRQYRGFREAIAWSLVLPPGEALPKRLVRYETKVQGGYSLRQQVLMVLAAKGRDPQQVVELVLASAPKLPQPIWSAGYDPYPRWTETFQGLVPAMIDAFGSTDACLARAEEQQRASAEAVRKMAQTAFGSLGKEPAKESAKRP